MYRLIAFDMDGTIVNSIYDIAAAMNRSLMKMGYEPHRTEDYYRMVGDGMAVLCRRAIPEASEAEVDKLISLYSADYYAHCCEKSVVYDGIYELIDKLREGGRYCVVLSNKPHDQAMNVAAQLFKRDAFDVVLGHTDRFPAKPAPESLLYLTDKLGVALEETMYIGDSNVDIRLGKAAGVFTVGVTWGFRGAEELATEGADKIVDTPEEIADLIL